MNVLASEYLKSTMTEYYSDRFIQTADPMGHFAFAWGASSEALSIGEGENHIRPAADPLALIRQHETELDDWVSSTLPVGATSGLPYGMQHSDMMELT